MKFVNPFQNIISRIKGRINRKRKPKFKISKLDNLERLGSNYGGWVIPKDFLNKNSICYLAGAGEDISFDLEVAGRYGSKIFIFDPTPRAKIHYTEVIEGSRQNAKVPINNSNEYYSLKESNLKNIQFVEVGLWYNQAELEFYAPRDKEHVSHSILNLQKTSNFFIAHVRRLSQIMCENNHKSLDLLKIDIEGAEYKVIDSIIEDQLDIKVICVEFDEFHNPLDGSYYKRIKQSVIKLCNYGYVLVDIDDYFNMTFVTKEVYDLLNIK